MVYIPRFSKNNRNVPILSKAQINSIAECFIHEFSPEIISNPQPFNIEGFIEQYLGLLIDFQYLSNDGRYLGMTVFNNTNKIPVYVPEIFQADYMYADRGTIIVDNTLLDAKQEHRYLFTLGHESGHWILHQDYYGFNSTQLSLFEDRSPYTLCREIGQIFQHSHFNKLEDSKWLEWQADYFSAALLMPKSSVKHILSSIDTSDIKYTINYISEIFNVSTQAASIRIRDLNYDADSSSNRSFNQLSFF